MTSAMQADWKSSVTFRGGIFAGVEQSVHLAAVAIQQTNKMEAMY